MESTTDKSCRKIKRIWLLCEKDEIYTIETSEILFEEVAERHRRGSCSNSRHVRLAVEVVLFET